MGCDIMDVWGMGMALVTSRGGSDVEMDVVGTRTRLLEKK